MWTPEFYKLPKRLQDVLKRRADAILGDILIDIIWGKSSGPETKEGLEDILLTNPDEEV